MCYSEPVDRYFLRTSKSVFPQNQYIGISTEPVDRYFLSLHALIVTNYGVLFPFHKHRMKTITSDL